MGGHGMRRFSFTLYLAGGLLIGLALGAAAFLGFPTDEGEATPASSTSAIPSSDLARILATDQSAAAPVVGAPAPDFELAALDGENVRLSDLRGQVVALNFWATWCVPCFEEHPLLVSAARSLGDRARFIGVIYEDSEEQVRGFLARQGSAYPSLVDPGSRTAIAFGVFGVPETFFIDAEGRIAAKHIGPLDAASLQAKLGQAGLAP
jgi:cytochrome c biogenesis protein CcmG/thiol:disulfide interchange protein DsbE